MEPNMISDRRLAGPTTLAARGQSSWQIKCKGVPRAEAKRAAVIQEYACVTVRTASGSNPSSKALIRRARAGAVRVNHEEYQGAKRVRSNLSQPTRNTV